MKRGTFKDRDGNQVPLGQQVWEIARRAVQVVTDDEEPTSDADLQMALREHETFLDDRFLVELGVMSERGKVTFQHGDFSTLLTYWKDYDWVQKHRVFIDGVKRTSFLKDGPDGIEFLRVFNALATLTRIDDAAIASQLQDIDEVCDCIADAYALSSFLVIEDDGQYLPIPRSLSEAAHLLGRRGPDQRHAKNREIKEATLKAYAQGTWASRSDAARRLSKQFSREFSTVKRWLEAADRKARS